MGTPVRRILWGAAMILMVMCNAASGDTIPLPLSTLLSTNESSALLSLKQAMGVFDSVWPGSSDPCSGWAGVSCESGHVVGVSISFLSPAGNGNQRAMSGLNSLLGLPFLKTLTVADFVVPEILPSWVGNLGSLESLSISNCSLNGFIPSSLGSLSKLESLTLARNNLQGNIPDMFSGLWNLTTIDMSSNALNGTLPVSLFNLSKLRVLDLSGNFLYGSISGSFVGLSSLQRLSLSKNLLDGFIPSQLGGLLQLREIDLSANQLSGTIPSSVGNITGLTGFSVADNKLSGAIPEQLTLCSELRLLNVGENQLNGQLPLSIGRLTNLVTLNCSWNELSGALPPGWDQLQVLANADFAHNLFYGPVQADLLALPKLSMLNISDNFFNESLPNVLPNVTVSKKNCLRNVPRQHLRGPCDKFYADKGVSPVSSPVVGSPAPSYGMGSPGAAPARHHHKHSGDDKHLVPLLAGVGGGLGLILIVGMLALCVHKMERKDPAQARMANGEAGFGSGGAGIIVSRLGEPFTYAQLQQATKKFHSSNLITSGHSGELYKGLLERGTTVVVKRIEASKFKKDSYVPELEVYGKATHSRLVSLVGYCLEREDEKLLVYKYMPNGDLSSALHTKGSPGPGDVLRSLDWITRLKVAIGAAEALAYLHHDITPALVHRDIRASSILLDDKFEVRLGSLSDVRSQDGDSHPGLIRRLLGLSQSSDQGLRDAGQSVASCALDVYNYGKVLLELVSGKLGISGASDPRTDAWLEWAVPLIDPHDKESLPKLVDPSLIVDEDLLEEVWAVAIIAKACLNPKSQKRPSMRHVLKALENPHKVIRQDFQFGDTLAMRTSSHSSWNEALFGSWRHSSVIPGTLREEYSLKAGGISVGPRGEFPQSHVRRGSSDIVPEPICENDYPRSR